MLAEAAAQTSSGTFEPANSVISGTDAIGSTDERVNDPPATVPPSSSRQSLGGGFGGYLPSPVRVSPQDRASRLAGTAKSLKQKISSVLAAKLQAKPRSLSSTINSIVRPKNIPMPFRSVLVTPSPQLPTNTQTNPPVRFAVGFGDQEGGPEIRTVSMQDPLDTTTEDTDPLNVQFSESTELPLESPMDNRTASIPPDWQPVEEQQPNHGDQPPPVFIASDNPDATLLPPAWQQQDENTDGAAELELSSPLNTAATEPQDSIIDNELRQNRDDQLRERLEGDMELRLLDNDRFGQDELPLKDQSCAAFRNKLLDNPITEIGLNISPPGSSRSPDGLKRVWTNAYGEVLATGILVDLSRGYAMIETDQGRKRLAVARLNDADWAAIAEQWRIPVDCSVGGADEVERNWQSQTFTWTATSLCHKPLYFENIQLERYGHSAGPILQPLQSTVHFFRSFVTLPVHMTLNPPRECQYALGYYRPGNCAPWLVPRLPFNVFDQCFYQQSQSDWSW